MKKHCKTLNYFKTQVFYFILTYQKLFFEGSGGNYEILESGGNPDYKCNVQSLRPIPTPSSHQTHEICF